MSRALLAGLFGFGLMACSGAMAGELEHKHADRWQPGNRALDRTLVVGTLIEATVHSPSSWRRNKPGEALTGTVSTDVRNAHGWVVIPAGCPVGVSIALWGPKILLDVTSVTVWGEVYPVSATVELTQVAAGRTSRAPGTRILFVLPEGLTVERRREEASSHAIVSPASK